MTENARQFQQKWCNHKNESFTDIENFEMNLDLIAMYQLCFYFSLEKTVIKIGNVA